MTTLGPDPRTTDEAVPARCADAGEASTTAASTTAGSRETSGPLAPARAAWTRAAVESGVVTNGVVAGRTGAVAFAPETLPTADNGVAVDGGARAGDDPEGRARPGGWWGRLTRLARGRADDPRWARPAVLALLAATAVLYLWGLGESGWANAFYSAAAQAGSASWEALFYGSSDASNSITVDKPPVAMWLMSLSVKIFGLSSWSILVPEALCGVASVGLLYASVRRAFSPAAGLIAGAVLATTPVAVLMFRFNNPDALLVLLLIGAVHATLRAVETEASPRARTWWMVLAGACIGVGFLTKMLQAFLIVPVLAVVYLAVGPGGVWRRVRDLLASGLALVVSAGWYVAVVELVPASSRPYIGGSQNNSLLELAFGYNGFGRLTGDETGSVGGGGAVARAGTRGAFGPPSMTGGGGWGETGWARMFNSEIGSQVSWLIPAALALLVAGIVVTARAPRTDRARAGFLVWGGWLVVTGGVFTKMQGIFHPYYTIALAPAIGALVGMGAVALWERRRHAGASLTLAAVTALSAWWCSRLLDRTPGWNSWLRPTVLVAGLGAAVLLAGLPRLAALADARRARPGTVEGLPAPRHSRFAGLAGPTIAGVGLVACLLGPTSYALATAGTGHTGAIPSAGPTASAGFGGGRGGFGQGNGQPQRQGQGQGQGRFPGFGGNGNGGGGFTLPGQGQGTAPTVPNGGPGGGGTTTPGQGGASSGTTPGQGGSIGGPFAGGRAGGMGGLLNATTPGANLTALLEKDASAYTWVAATAGSMNAAGYQLATREPVMPIGGFNGTDPAPTLAQFKQYVAEKKIHYFLGGGLTGTGNGGSQDATRISTWVEETFTPTTVDGVTVYDLTGASITTTTTGSGTTRTT